MTYPGFSLQSLQQRMPAPVAAALAGLQTGALLDGFLHVTAPEALDDTLAEWLGVFDPARTPFARTALGDLIYVRDLRERAAELGLDPAEAAVAHDVSRVDVRFKKVDLLATTFQEFVTNLSDPSWLSEELDKDLFDGALGRLGPPTFEEIYAFVPALALGGRMHPDNLERKRADVALAILLQV